jgi:uncharacterized oligopeptide transporter (OPT) family protein
MVVSQQIESELSLVRSTPSTMTSENWRTSKTALKAIERLGKNLRIRALFVGFARVFGMAIVMALLYWQSFSWTIFCLNKVFVRFLPFNLHRAF